MNKKELRQKALEVLNKYWPSCQGGQVDGFTYDDEDGNEVELTPQQFAEKEGVVFVEGYLDDHPEGSDRGGFVPWVTLKLGGKEVTVYHYEPDGEWHSA